MRPRLQLTAYCSQPIYEAPWFRQVANLPNMKTLLNNPRAYIAYDDDGYLLHTDKKTGKQRISLKTWAGSQHRRRLPSHTVGPKP